MRVAVIGGSGSFGRIFAGFFKEEGCEVVITGRNRAKGERVARELGVSFTTDNVEAAADSDIVVISVYIENTLDVIKEVAPHVKDGALLTDVTSVKSEPCQAMLKYANPKADIVGMHPMFGPRITSLEGQTVVVTPVRGEKWRKFLIDFLEKRKARVYVTTPEEHDRIMGVVQGLTHFAYISLAYTLKDLGVDVKHSRKFASPVYELMLDFIARIVGQSPRLYASIQMHNPYTAEVRRVFLEKVRELKEVIERRDGEAFRRIMAESARHIGDIDTSMGRSDKAILALTGELKKLSSAVGREVALRHIYSGAVHVGVVSRVTPEDVVLKTSRGELTLKLSNVELLGDDFLTEWKLRNLPRTSWDFSVIYPEALEEEPLCRLVEVVDPRIVSCKVIDVYRGKQVPKGKKSITLRVEAINFSKDAFKKVEKVLLGLGGRLR
jgi:prephenate dehydrogenase